MLTFDLTNRVAIVTGASRGIGASIAEQYAASGAKTVVHYRSDKTGALKVVEKILSTAEVLALKDGTSVDGKVLREDGGFIWVKTLSGTVKLTVAEVEGRTEGESPFDAYERFIFPLHKVDRLARS